MSVKTLTCYIVTCDTCGKDIESYEYEGDTYRPHFDSADVALNALGGDPDAEDNYNATLDGQRVDGQDICGACNTKRVCAERGHRWGDWGPCYCRGINNDRPPREGHEDGCPQWRDCQRDHCHEREWKPQAVSA